MLAKKGAVQAILESGSGTQPTSKWSNKTGSFQRAFTSSKKDIWKGQAALHKVASYRTMLRYVQRNKMGIAMPSRALDLCVMCSTFDNSFKPAARAIFVGAFKEFRDAYKGFWTKLEADLEQVVAWKDTNFEGCVSAEFLEKVAAFIQAPRIDKPVAELDEGIVIDGCLLQRH